MSKTMAITPLPSYSVFSIRNPLRLFFIIHI